MTLLDMYDDIQDTVQFKVEHLAAVLERLQCALSLIWARLDAAGWDHRLWSAELVKCLDQDVSISELLRRDEGSKKESGAYLN
jgi:hypothetical protein